MLTRRSLLAAMPAAAAAAAVTPALADESILTEDGLYIQPWFLESFLEVASDLDETNAKGKRLAVIWELKGCPACKQLHLVNFAKPELSAFIKERFEILQLNIIGSREVTDFDGEKLSEKRLAEKYGVRFTPTIQFFPPSSAGLATKKPRDREVTRAQGYLEPKDFRALFAFVSEKAYERGTLADYIKAQG